MGDHELSRQGLSLTLLCDGNTELALDGVGTQEVAVDPESGPHVLMTTPRCPCGQSQAAHIPSFVSLAGLFECAGWRSCLIQVDVEQKTLLSTRGSD